MLWQEFYVKVNTGVVFCCLERKHICVMMLNRAYCLVVKQIKLYCCFKVFFIINFDLISSKSTWQRYSLVMGYIVIHLIYNTKNPNHYLNNLALPLDGENQTKIDPKIGLGNKSLPSQQWDLAIFFFKISKNPRMYSIRTSFACAEIATGFDTCELGKANIAYNEITRIFQMHDLFNCVMIAIVQLIFYSNSQLLISLRWHRKWCPAILCTNDGLPYWHIYASLGIHRFTYASNLLLYNSINYQPQQILINDFMSKSYQSHAVSRVECAVCNSICYVLTIHVIWWIITHL